MILKTFKKILYMYIAPGQGQTTPWGQNFNVDRNSLSLSICCQFKKKISLKSDFCVVVFFWFFFFYSSFHMYIAPSRGRQPIGDKNFMTTERPFLFAHMLQVSKSVKSDFIHIFNDLIYVYSLGARAENPLGTNF